MKARRIAADLKVYSHSYMRTPEALFFALLFPIILILLFGVIFNSGGSTKVNIDVQNLDGNSNASVMFVNALGQTGVLSVTIVSPTAGNLSAYLAANGQTTGLVIPSGFQQGYETHHNVSVILYTDPSDQSGAGVAEGAVSGVVNAFNLAASGGKSIIQVAPQTVGSHVYTYLDYLTPGLIGFSILTSPMFSMVNIIAEYKKERIFRQLSLTPLTKSEWLTSKIIWFVILSFVAAATIIFTSVGVFGTHITLDPLAIPFFVVGPLLFVSLGMLAGTVAKTPESAAVIGNLITFPMMFLAGTFFPVQNFSPGLQAVAHALPLYYLIDGLNQAMIFSNTGKALFDLAVTSVIAAVFFVAAVLAFKWREA